MRTKVQADRDFLGFCEQATDSQLEEILRREWARYGKPDYAMAELAAAKRGWGCSRGAVIDHRCGGSSRTGRRGGD